VWGRGDVAIAVMLIDNRIELVACHAAFATSALQMKKECRRRGEFACAFVGQWTLELTERLVLERLFVLSEGTEVNEFLVASFAVEVGLFVLSFLEDSSLPLGLFEFSASDNFRMAIAEKVMIQRLVATELTLAVGTFKAGDVNVGTLVVSIVRGATECFIVLCTVAMVGCLLMTQAVDRQGEDLDTDWARMVLVCNVLISRFLILEGQLVNTEPTLARVCVRLREVKASVSLAFEVVSNIALMVFEGCLARYDCAAMALEEMTEGGGVFVRRFNSRECRSTQTSRGHFCEHLL
jgi:hypothetical protein